MRARLPDSVPVENQTAHLDLKNIETFPERNTGVGY